MAFVVEDGTGLSNSTSYASEAEFDAYWTDRGRDDLVGQTTADKEAALILATDWVDLSFRFRGIRRRTDFGGPDQALEWPRRGVRYAHSLRLIEDDVVPVEIKRTTIEAAAFALTDELLPNTGASADRQVVSETKKAGPLSVTTRYHERLARSPVLRKATRWLDELRAGEGFLRA